MIRLATIALMFTVVTVSFGAKYKGRDIDGKKYDATVKGEGVIRPARVVFNGRYVEIYLEKRVVTAKLGSEIIENPHDIEAWNDTEHWTIDVSGLD